MRISAYNHQQQLVNKSEKSRLSFQGYAACPLKALYLQPDRQIENLNVARELKEIGEKEGFDILVQIEDKLYNNINEIPTIDNEVKYNAVSKWGQDNKVFLQNKGKEEIACNGVVFYKEENMADYLAFSLNLPYKKMRSSLDGGNFFICKKGNGELLGLVGKDSLTETACKLALEDMGKEWKHKNSGEFDRLFNNPKFIDFFDKNEETYLEKAKKQIARDLRLKPEQVHYISQLEYHLDMAIRPLNYPYILVNDTSLFTRAINDSYHAKNINNTQANKLINIIKDQKEINLGGGKPRKISQIEDELGDLGFEVIRVPGIFPEQANFMNAIVHQRPDGSLVYITNKSNCQDLGVDLDKTFENFIKQEIPAIKEVKFISGGKYSHGNFMNYLLYGGQKGGIHCMVTERPDFDRWV